MVESGPTQPLVVDLKRHNDGEDGLVGPFNSRAAAQQYIDSIESKFEREWATIRPVAVPAKHESAPRP